MHPYLTKLRKNGFVWFCRRAINRLFRLCFGDVAYRRVKRLIGFFRWISATPGKLISSPAEKDRRLLMIYDFDTQPFSIGDILVIQEASLVLRDTYTLDLVDFALVYNPKSPSVSNNPIFNFITEKNVTYHLTSILPVVQVNPHLGSVFIFNSHLQLKRFVADNVDLYQIWPSAWKLALSEYWYFSVFNELLYNYYQEHQTIPFLTSRKLMVEWAQAFFREHVYPQVPVTVQVRNNRKFATHRNLHLESWLDFFDYCQEHYPVKFVVICAQDEIDDRLRQFTNVIIAKDYHTGIEQDLALVQMAALHMGASSGPATMAIFNNRPYLIVNTDLVLEQYRDMRREGTFVSFCFANPLQRLTLKQETTKLLIEEFAKMWEAVDVEKWRSASPTEEVDHLTWLR